MSEALKIILSRCSNLADIRCIKFGAFFDQSFSIPEPEWSPQQMADQTGKTVIVTGGNSGVGKECVKVLLMKNAKVYIASRNPKKANAAIEELFHVTGRRAHFIQLDLGDLGSVKAAVEEFMSKESQLHVLINNAGLASPMRNNCNGYDPHIHVHTLGHFHLTMLLLPTLLSTRASGYRPRVVHLSSVLHYLSKSEGPDFATFKCGPARDKQTTAEMYLQSKLCNILLSNEFANRHAKAGLISVAVNPGNLRTSIAEEHSKEAPVLGWFLGLLMKYPAYKGAITPLWAAFGAEPEVCSGKYLIPWAKVGRPHQAAHDPQLGKALWDWLEEQVALHEHK